MRNRNMKNVFRLGRRARTVFLITALLTAVQAVYILYLAMSVSCGEYPLRLEEVHEFIESEGISLILSLGGTFLMDIEEKNAARN